MQIEYDLDALARIEDEVASGLKALPEGGAEVGGILLGTYDGDRLQVSDFEPLPSDPDAGPLFLMSDIERAALAERIRFHNSRTRATGRRVVGWYHSHTRSGLAMSPEDLAVHERYFPEPWQVALVLHPDGQGVMDAKFFLRENAASAVPLKVSAQPAPAPEPELPRREPLSIARPPAEARVPRSRRPGPPLAPPAAPSYPGPAQGPPLPASAGPRPVNEDWLSRVQNEYLEAAKADSGTGRKRSMGIWIGLAAMALVPLGGFFYLRNFYSPATHATPAGFLKMEALRHNSNIELTWDPTAMLNVTQGELDIQDGPLRSQVTLDQATLASGRFTYASRSDVTGFKLHVDRSSGSPLEGSTTFVASDSNSPATGEVARAVDPGLPPDLAKPADAPKDVVEEDAPKADKEKESARDKEKHKKKLEEEAAKRAREQAETERLESERLAEKARAARFREPAKPASTTAAAADRIKNVEPPTLVAQSTPPSGASPLPQQVVPQIRPPAPPPPPVATPQPAAATPKPAPPPMEIGGRWTLQPGSTSRSPAVPEAVSINVSDTNGSVQGTLDARYKSGSKKEHMVLNFSGKMVNGTARFPWTSPDGKKGQIEFIRVPSSPNHIEVVWYGPDSKQVFNEIVRKN